MEVFFRKILMEEFFRKSHVENSSGRVLCRNSARDERNNWYSTFRNFRNLVWNSAEFGTEFYEFGTTDWGAEAAALLRSFSAARSFVISCFFKCFLRTDVLPCLVVSLSPQNLHLDVPLSNFSKCAQTREPIFRRVSPRLIIRCPSSKLSTMDTRVNAATGEDPVSVRAEEGSQTCWN